MTEPTETVDDVLAEIRAFPEAAGIRALQVWADRIERAREREAKAGGSAPDGCRLLPREPSREMLYMLATRSDESRDDAKVGKEHQRRVGTEVVPPRHEYEAAVGFWFRFIDKFGANPPASAPTGCELAAEAIAYHNAVGALECLSAVFSAMDNSDTELEQWPQRAIDVLACAGWAVVPCDLPFEVLGEAGMIGIFETGNPKHGWDFLLAKTRIRPDGEPARAGATADVSALAAEDGPLACAELFLRMGTQGCDDRDDGSIADGLKDARAELKRVTTPPASAPEVTGAFGKLIETAKLLNRSFELKLSRDDRRELWSALGLPFGFSPNIAVIRAEAKEQFRAALTAALTEKSHG